MWAPVASVARLVAAAIASLGISANKPGAGTSGPVSRTSMPSKRSGVTLERRAVRVCNRQPEQIDRYLAVHRTLGRES